MRLTLATIALASTCSSAYADPVLLGKWRSDRQLTMQFARDRAKLEDKTLLFLEQLMGKMTVTFSPNRIVSEMPDWQSKNANGEKSGLAGFKEVHRYKLLATTPTQVAVSSVEPVTGRRTITVYNFENKNTMWVYLGASAFSEMNIREYFVRIE